MLLNVLQENFMFLNKYFFNEKSILIDLPIILKLQNLHFFKEPTFHNITFKEIWVILFSGMNWKNWVEGGLERERGGVFTNIVKQLCF